MTASAEPDGRRARRVVRPARRRASARSWARRLRPRRRGSSAPRPARARRPSAVGAAVLLAASAVRRALGPVVGVVTALGWIVLGSGLASLLAGALLGWLEFTALGAVLLAALVVSGAFLAGRTAYRVRIELEPRRVVAGDRALGRLVVTGASGRRSSPSRLELPVGAGAAEFEIPALGPGDEHDELFAVPTERRAVIVAGPALSVRGDQLGMLRRTVAWGDAVELFVHPRTVRLSPSAAGLTRDLEGATTPTITNDDITFHALRAYEPGDDRRTVHWRTSARTGQLMVRQFEETRRSQLALVLDVDRARCASDDEFELAVSIAASIGVQALRDGTSAALVTESGALRTATPTALLDDTCRLEQRDSPHATLREAARAATRRLAPPSLLVVVGGSGLTVADVRAVRSLFSIDTTTLGLRAALDEPSAVSVVDGLRVATVGSLADLPRLIRRLS